MTFGNGPKRTSQSCEGSIVDMPLICKGKVLPTADGFSVILTNRGRLQKDMVDALAAVNDGEVILCRPWEMSHGEALECHAIELKIENGTVAGVVKNFLQEQFLPYDRDYLVVETAQQTFTFVLFESAEEELGNLTRYGVRHLSG